MPEYRQANRSTVESATRSAEQGTSGITEEIQLPHLFGHNYYELPVQLIGRLVSHDYLANVLPICNVDPEEHLCQRSNRIWEAI